AFAVVFFMAYRPLRDLGDARSALERGADAMRVLDELAEPPKEVRVAEAARRWRFDKLVVESVGVRRDVPSREGRFRTEPLPLTSFLARPGEVVAVVGPTGA